MRITLTFFGSLFTPQGRAVRTSWPAMLDRLGRPSVYARKEDAPRWSAASFEGDRRSLANVRSLCAVVLDVDAGAELAAVIAVLDDLFAFVHSTWSATPDRPRWRVVIPLDRVVTTAEHERVWRWAASRLERAGIEPDYAARDASRIWALPSIAAGGAYVHRVLEGAFAEVDHALAAIPETKLLERDPRGPDRTDDLEKRIERARRWLACVDPAISGAGGHTVTFRAALGLVRGFALPIDDALRLLVEEYNPRCQPAWSTYELRHKVRSAATRARVNEPWLLNARRSA